MLSHNNLTVRINTTQLDDNLTQVDNRMTNRDKNKDVSGVLAIAGGDSQLISSLGTLWDLNNHGFRLLRTGKSAGRPGADPFIGSEYHV